MNTQELARARTQKEAELIAHAIRQARFRFQIDMRFGNVLADFVGHLHDRRTDPSRDKVAIDRNIRRYLNAGTDYTISEAIARRFEDEAGWPFGLLDEAPSAELLRQSQRRMEALARARKELPGVEKALQGRAVSFREFLEGCERWNQEAGCWERGMDEKTARKTERWLLMPEGYLDSFTD